MGGQRDESSITRNGTGSDCMGQQGQGLAVNPETPELSRTLGAGPWFLRERGVFPNQLYQGQSSTKALAIAMGYAGDMQIEIIKQLDGSASVYREHTERSAYGLPHFGVAASGYQAALSD
jgi:hypothetical protein